MDTVIGNFGESKVDNYGIGGIIQFLKNQSMVNEIIRAQWNVEKAELQARIAFLQGERRGQENLKVDLVKRIKMLEYALKQENKKINILRSQKSISKNESDLIETNINFESVNTNSREKHVQKSTDKTYPFNIKDIREFLVDNGFRDMMSEIRESRVKQLLGLSNDVSNSMNILDKGHMTIHGNSASEVHQLERNFPTQIDIFPDLNFRSDIYKYEHFDNKTDENYDDSPIYDTVDDSSTFDEKFIILSTNKSNTDYPISVDKLPHPEILGGNESNSALGELASLTIVNEAADSESNVENVEATVQKHNNRISWSPKFSLRSHFDSIRCLSFHETKPLLITGSEDRCLKLWNLVKTYHSKKSSSNFEIEPIYTFRGHQAPVLSLTINDETIYSGDLDGDIKIWNIPSRIELYDEFNPNVLSDMTLKHPNAVWTICLQKATNTLLSGSADGTVYLWNTSTIEKPQKKIFLSNSCISSMSLTPLNDENFMVGTSTGEVLLVNSETSQTVCNFVSEEMSPVYKLIIHPNKTLIITGHEDRKIRMFDMVSGKLVTSLVAHLDAVTSVAIENKSGSHHLLSGSHDCSIRLWDLSSQACIQETTSHRKKFGESINDISVHPTLQYFATAGSDAISKVFV